MSKSETGVNKMSENERAVLKRVGEAYANLSEEEKKNLCLIAQGFVLANEINQQGEQEGTQ